MDVFRKMVYGTYPGSYVVKVARREFYADSVRPGTSLNP
jgi:hypothetical protein